jgi:hypothetical protein
VISLIAMQTKRGSGLGILMAAGFAGIAAVAGIAAAVFLVISGVAGSGGCGGTGVGGGAGAVALGPAGTGQTVGATEYGGPGDPSSGVVGSSGVNLSQAPDSYAELGGYSFQTAVAMGGLPYGTPLRITWGGHSAIAYKRDIGFGGSPVGGLPRVIDLWWQLAGGLGIPYEQGLWSGPVRVSRPPATGAAEQLGAVHSVAPAASGASCAPAGGLGVPLAPGERATLLPDGQAAAPASSPAGVRAMIAAGDQIAGRPYLYGGGHGLPLNVLSPSYDCSSSVDHILYAAGLLPVTATIASGALESFGLPGPGRWVTIYASSVHVFMYVAGLRWDTHNAAGPGDGVGGIGWHPLVRDAAGFVARHPVGL